MVIGRITEAAKRVRGFEKMPVTAQVALLLNEIEEARRMRIPLAFICEEMNAAGSLVTLGYLRRALSVVRKRMPGLGMQPAATPSQGASKAPSASSSEPGPGLTKKEAREAKVDQYMGGNNPLLRMIQKHS
ncbi:hypothetical protein V2S84_00025 [Azotobacter chroococcum]|nr:hypothetical protein [Azotobacter chroococcum]